MSKYLPKIISLAPIAFVVWFALSYIEVVAKNIEGAPLIWCNFFQFFLN